MIECSLAQECEGEQKGTGATIPPCCLCLAGSLPLLVPIPPHAVSRRDLCGLYSALSQDGKLVVEDIPLVVWRLCFGKVGGVISFLFGPVRGYHWMGHSVS